MNTDIRDSVGDPKEGATNRTDDVKIVQGLLNMQAVSRNHVDRLLELDGRMGRETLAAIVVFQRREGFAQTGIRPESSRHAMRPLASCAASVREP